MCSYSSNRYPAETDQQDQEMRNINEDVEGQKEGGGSDAEVDSSERISLLFVILILLNSILVLFILSRVIFS